MEDKNLMIDIQDGTTGQNRKIVSYDEFVYELHEIKLGLTVGEYLILREIRKAIIEDKHDIFIRIGSKR